MGSGTHAGSRHRASRGVLVSIVVMAVLAAVAAGVGYVVAQRDAPEAQGGAASGPGCRVESVDVTVAPRMKSLVRSVLDTMATDCRRFELSTQGERQALDAVFFGGDVPDLWIPDGDWGLAKMPVDVVSSGLASTPVLLVGGPGVRPSATWGEALSSGVVAMPDPLTDSIGTLAMLAPRQEAQASGQDLQAARAFLVPTAQAYGEVVADGRKLDLSLRSITPTSTRLVATTEDAYLDALATNEALRPVVPATGAALMTFPLAVRNDASAGVREAADRMAAWFASDEGLAAVRDDGLRPGDGAPVAKGVGMGRLTYLPSPGSADVDDYRFTWQVMSVPSSVLAVFDVSGSMDFATPDQGRRIDVAVGAASVALEVFPGSARIGLWAFSIDRGGPGQDWRVLEPVRRLDAPVAGVTHRERLAVRAQELGSLTTGGTGLHDTALAAYRQALRVYDPNYANSVILLTDGANDDPGSIGEAALLRRLEALVDPQRPVRIIGVAVSDDADLGALQRIAEATGGRAYRADTPEDILRVFSQEIANR